MDHCPHCPVDLDKRPCPAVARNHARFCELTDPSHPAYQEAYVYRLRGEALPCGPKADVPAPAPDPSQTPVPKAPVVVVRERISTARRYQLLTCLYREQGCGCEAPKCWWTGQKTTLKDCQKCHP